MRRCYKPALDRDSGPRSSSSSQSAACFQARPACASPVWIVLHCCYLAMCTQLKITLAFQPPRCTLCTYLIAGKQPVHVKENRGSDQKSVCPLCLPGNFSYGLCCHFKGSKWLGIQLVSLPMAGSPVSHFIMLYFRAVLKTGTFLIVNSRTKLHTVSSPINRFEEYLQ